ncbi:transcriptional regulator, TetR family [Quadrisphaera granulorum]|uniref:TetR family transcriptional regulator n=1 Tax=Quadrisphaera granulorum TaxID=317664 RepID=A0A315ZTH6_9ACTN|nr:TetR/AcrR family transcriptional regulator [Quadrisphaera granulorum]PWJ48178.1 TetR family transcriptional regulator [Quadrisphaera granulorum]SZE98547.1 transcriptional regulator, TetR family [Quadrisphaera granulorum]
MGTSSRRTAEDWVAAAYDRFRTDGLAAVRVEAVARDLGATKGSFYWHFADRAALVAAVVERWERERTDRLVAAADATDGPADPRARLERLFAAVAADPVLGEDPLYLEAADEGVAEAVARVSQRRVEHVAALLEELGVEPRAAHQRALLALASALGLRQLARIGLVGGASPAPSQGVDLVDLLTAPSADARAGAR